MMKNVKLSFQIGAVFIGTVVGAGFATGQEILQFFTVFGKVGMVTLLLTAWLFYGIAAAVMKAASRYRAYNYRDLLYRTAGRRLGFVYDVIITAFLLIGTSIMFAGSGALFGESLGIPPAWGIVLIAVLTLVVILQSLTGILRINSIIVPVLLFVVSSVLIKTVASNGMGNLWPKLAENYQGGYFKPVFFFIFYCCYNTFLSIGVLAAIPEKINKPSVLKAGAFIGAAGLMLLSLMLNICLTLKSPQIFNYSIPMGYITLELGNITKGAVTLCIWCEIFSTAVSNAFSVAKRLCNAIRLPYAHTCFAVVLCCLPLAFFEFRRLIGFFYPLFGALSMFIMARMLYISGFMGRIYSIKH